MNRRSQEGRWQIDRSLNSAKCFLRKHFRSLWETQCIASYGSLWETQCIASYGSLCRAWTPVHR
ncbi:hypothetical protein [Leptospira noguchii]|uniref:hypothetical protein n=1 Tax=Leptospira noguchii TaxID=28182 RepID=UPI0018DEDDCC|nr:hypothetical protein [Leptospira noguchii]